MGKQYYPWYITADGAKDEADAHRRRYRRECYDRWRHHGGRALTGKVGRTIRRRLRMESLSRPDEPIRPRTR